MAQGIEITTYEKFITLGKTQKQGDKTKLNPYNDYNNVKFYMHTEKKLLMLKSAGIAGPYINYYIFISSEGVSMVVK